MTLQSSFSLKPAEGILGMLTGGLENVSSGSRAARGLIKAGYGVFRVKPSSVGGAGARGMSDPGQCYQSPYPGAAADADAISLAAASAAAPFSATAGGVVGAAEMYPPRQITITIDTHADWDATDVVVTFVNHLGQTVSETLSIPDGGNTVLTTAGYAKQFVSAAFDAQSGAGGSYQIGVAALATLTIADFDGTARFQPVHVTRSSSAIYGKVPDPGVADYVDGEMVPVLRKGQLWVYTEEAVSDGDPVFVRISAGAGGSALGAFRNDADGGSCVQVVGALFIQNSSAGAAPAHF